MLRAAPLAAALLVVLTSAPRLHAQAERTDSARSAVQPGSEVRVLVPLVSRRWMDGSLVRADGDSVLVYGRHTAFLAVPTWQVERLRTSAGRDHAAGAVRGLLLGVGAAVVVTAFIAVTEKGRYDDGYGTALVGIGSLAILPPVGLVAGAVAGQRKWRDAPLPWRAPADSSAAGARP
jgi:hypothetical protein